LGKFWKVLQWKVLVFLLPFFLVNSHMVYLFYGYLVHFVVIWYIFATIWVYVEPRKIWQPCFDRVEYVQEPAFALCLMRCPFTLNIFYFWLSNFRSALGREEDCVTERAECCVAVSHCPI
jgi:hypothetical protein